MTKDDLNKLIDAIMKRGNPAYTTPSGACLELLRDHASLDKLEAMAEAVDIYERVYPGVSAFIRAQIPAILVSHCLCLKGDLDFDAFAHWSMEHPDWGQEVREACGTSPYSSGRR